MPQHVLVVDDSLTVRMDLRAALTAAGFMIKTCSTIEAARSELSTHAFDLVFLDILLPDGSGIDLLKQIKETPELRSIRVIMLSTEAEVRSRIQGLRLGADHYVGKPYDRAKVVRVARELFLLPDASGASPVRRASCRAMGQSARAPVGARRQACRDGAARRPPGMRSNASAVGGTSATCRVFSAIGAMVFP